MPLIDIDSAGALSTPQLVTAFPRLVAFAKMGDVQLRDWRDAAAPHGLFLAESLRSAQSALDAGVHPWALLIERSWQAACSGLVDRVLETDPSVPVHIASLDAFAQITGYRITRGPLVAMARPAQLSVEEVLRDACRAAVLEDVGNYANIAGIFRSASALGIDAVLVTPSCHDPLFRRALRIGQGAAFRVPWARIGTVQGWAAEGVPLLHRLGFKVAALALSDDSVALGDERVAAEPRLALVLGTEGAGLAPETIECCDWTVRIPMMHEVDSLNVAAAGAVAFWELRSRR